MNYIRIIYSIILWIIIPIAIFIISLAGLIYINDIMDEIINEKDQVFYKETISISFYILSKLFRLVLVIVNVLFIIKLFRFFFYKIDYISKNKYAKLIGLASVAIFYSNVFIQLYFFTLNASFNVYDRNLNYIDNINLVNNQNELINNKNTKLDSLIYGSKVEKVKDIIPISLNAINYSFSKIFDDYIVVVYKAFERIMIIDFIKGLAIWLVVVKLIDIISDNPDSLKIKLSSITNYISPLRRNIILFSILFFLSIFFCISALVAIPWLEQADIPAPVKKEQLRLRLSSNILSDTIFNQRFPKNLQVNDTPYVSLQKFASINKSDSLNIPYLKNSLNKQNWDRGINFLISDLNSHFAQKNAFIKRWLKLREAVLNNQKIILNEAESKYDRFMLRPMSTEERVVYFESIVSDASSKLSQNQELLINELDLTDQLERDIQTSASLTESRIKDFETNLQQLNDSTFSLISSPYYHGDLADYPYYTSKYSNSYEDEFEPTELNQKAGNSWGLFGWISSWLLEANSIALVFLTGMFGFGLLGASISFFVRNPIASKFGSIPLIDLLGIIIRGFVAAIVIYLIVQGGLSIFNSTVTKPNPYILFFTCIIGAVYSEDAWNRFYIYFTKENENQKKQVEPPKLPQQGAT